MSLRFEFINASEAELLLSDEEEELEVLVLESLTLGEE